jgi:hypothetical protein
MKQSEIRAGETYHNGRDEERAVLAVLGHRIIGGMKFPGPWIQWLKRKGAGRFGGYCSPLTFTIWAKGKVERP